LTVVPTAGTLAAASTLQAGTLCVEIKGGIFASNQRLALAPCAASPAQVFQASAAPNSNRIQAVNTASGTFCLSASGTAVGAAVVLSTCGTGDTQKWAVDSAGRLVPRTAMTRCLDTEGSSLAAGARLVLASCSDTPSLMLAVVAGEL
jgi:hypothetical protein